MITDPDTYANELIAAGAVWATLIGAGKPDTCELVLDEDGQPTNALHVRFDFLKSRYRVTVTMDPADTDPRPTP